MGKKSDEKLYAPIDRYEEIVMRKALLDTQIAVLKIKSERLQTDLNDLKGQHICDYEMPDWYDMLSSMAQLEEIVMEKAMVDAKIAVLKMKSERLQTDIDDFRGEHIEDYELPDYDDVFMALKNLSK